MGGRRLRTNIYGQTKKSTDHIKHTAAKDEVNNPLKHSMGQSGVVIDKCSKEGNQATPGVYPRRK